MNNESTMKVKAVERPKQFQSPQLTTSLVEVDNLVQAAKARQHFQVSGTGLTVAVIDTGLNKDHVDFSGRVPAQRNFTEDNSSADDDATDGNGHGTNVGGIVAAKGDHTGIAPDAQIIPLKVLDNYGQGSFGAVADALQWVIHNRDKYQITAVCMSLGNGFNYMDDGIFAGTKIKKHVSTLRNRNIPVCIAAGNDFFIHNSFQGMSFPGILRESVSVGAVYDEYEGPFRYKSGAETSASGPDRITPFSQRLHETVNPNCRTDIFAPGAPVRSAGINGPHGESVQHGTSQATPVTTGVILLMQEFYKRETHRMPKVDQMVDWLRRGGVRINDGDDELDNVKNTGHDFVRITAVGALNVIRLDLEKELAETGKLLIG